MYSIINPLITTLKPQSNGPSYSNTVIGTLAVDGWAVTFGIMRKGLCEAQPAQALTHYTKCNSQPINSQCTNFILFDVALQLPSKSKGLRVITIRLQLVFLFSDIANL